MKKYKEQHVTGSETIKDIVIGMSASSRVTAGIAEIVASASQLTKKQKPAII